ncbi:MAG: cbb3-type cytochrome oxidase assembly protein CcoS [Gammaproteobacteria bacterium]
MEILYVLIPISLLLVGLVAVILFWAVRSGQFEDLEGPAHRILMDEDDVPRPSVQGHRRHRAMDE